MYSRYLFIQRPVVVFFLEEFKETARHSYFQDRLVPLKIVISDFQDKNKSSYDL